MIVIILFLLTKGEICVTYPQWFTEMPLVNDTLYAVGYSYVSTLHPENSYKKALENLLTSLVCFRESQIEGKWRYIQRGYETVLVGGKCIEILLDSLSEEEVEVVDTATVGDMFIILGKIYCPKVKGKRELKDRWWEKIPYGEEFIYAVGTSPLYYHEENSWILAEKNARVNLATTILLQVKSLLKMYENSMEKVVEEKVGKVKLSNVQVVARKMISLSGSKICYVLVRMSKENLIKSLNY